MRLHHYPWKNILLQNCSFLGGVKFCCRGAFLCDEKIHLHISPSFAQESKAATFGSSFCSCTTVHLVSVAVVVMTSVCVTDHWTKCLLTLKFYHMIMICMMVSLWSRHWRNKNPLKALCSWVSQPVLWLFFYVFPLFLLPLSVCASISDCFAPVCYRVSGLKDLFPGNSVQRASRYVFSCFVGFVRGVTQSAAG